MKNAHVKLNIHKDDLLLRFLLLCDFQLVD